ncbi:hypothetical protein PXO_02727 [Xanthomonas oryzae pv. oryzae PXO99A]|uniref:Uncharacterized protein n=1 Tax=Xanthomonas oryzae pv. oryzae (strain PXO99A) TaxID=360094 RepID=A0A0K0GQ19_XANOP|nr:hypothetical protein PXO_02727 [Xanthomonas oryzae pv. oryzae PXO99A]
MPQCGRINTIYTNMAKPVRQSFHHSRRRSNATPDSLCAMRVGASIRDACHALST